LSRGASPRYRAAALRRRGLPSPPPPPTPAPTPAPACRRPSSQTTAGAAAAPRAHAAAMPRSGRAGHARPGSQPLGGQWAPAPALPIGWARRRRRFIDPTNDVTGLSRYVRVCADGARSWRCRCCKAPGAASARTGAPPLRRALASRRCPLPPLPPAAVLPSPRLICGPLPHHTRTRSPCAATCYPQALGILFDPDSSFVKLRSIEATGPSTIEADYESGGYLKLPWHPRVAPYAGQPPSCGAARRAPR
jgi:hypothetical protein